MRRCLMCLGTIAVMAIAAGCGSSASTSSSSAAATTAAGSSSAGATGTATQAAASTGSGKSCTASIGHVGPLTGPAAQLGQEQLHWDELAVQNFNKANGTDFKLVQGDAQLQASQAVVVARQFVSNPSILAIVGPASTQAVESAGPIFKRADMAMVSMSSTDTVVANGQLPDFFRVNASNSTQIPLLADFLTDTLHAKDVMVVDDQTPDKTQLADAVTALLKQHGVTVDRESIPQSQTDYSSLVTKITPSTKAVLLSWQVAANAQQFAQQAVSQGKKAIMVGANGVYSPTQFTPNGGYVASFAPDIRFLPSDKQIVAEADKQYGKTWGTYGPPTYAAATVLMTAIDSVCKSGQTPTRASVLAAVHKTDIQSSILGYPLHFDSHGNDPDATFILFHIVNGKYTPAFHMVDGKYQPIH